mmetsp:Transcript_2642/g.4413  ORF Transcript_2642/g.4413 Transcript_2642/m.4413 type:complete len:320 (+) Transcript_2642:934-1893(+)
MSRGLIGVDILETISNQNVFNSYPLVAPSLYLKLIWDKDSDFKHYYEQILANLHDANSLRNPTARAGSSEYGLPHDLAQFYKQNGIELEAFLENQHASFQNWGVDEKSILQEIDRQELPALDHLSLDSPGSDESQQSVTLLFTLRWFNSEIVNKSRQSDLVKGLFLEPRDLEEDAPQDQLSGPKVRSQNELLTLCYLSFLEQNQYLKSSKRHYLFGDLIQSINQPVFQEQVFLFLEMLKIYFPGGDPLKAPKSLEEFDLTLQIEQSLLEDPIQKELNMLDNLSKPSNQEEILLLSRIFSLFSIEQVGVDLSSKQGVDVK